jgi:hypothetical protein
VRHGLRVAYLVAAVPLLLILPVGDVTMLLALCVAVDLAAAALMLRPAAAQPTTVVPLEGDTVSLELMRRTVPALRMRRPTATIEAQVLWRQAAETHRQRRTLFRSTRRK